MKVDFAVIFVVVLFIGAALVMLYEWLTAPRLRDPITRYAPTPEEVAIKTYGYNGTDAGIVRRQPELARRIMLPQSDEAEQ
jgi:hypothetical protein